MINTVNDTNNKMNENTEQKKNCEDNCTYYILRNVVEYEN